MTSLIRMRLSGFVRGGRILAPVITALVVLGVIHGGGQSAAAPAYGYSAVMFFPVFAWLTKLLLDAEPDVQRRLARIAVGPVREAAAGALAAAVSGSVFCVVAIVAPLPLGAIRGAEPGEPSMATGIGLGVLAHLLSLAAGMGLGALASRAVTRTVRAGVTVLVTGAVLGVVLGLQGSVAPWSVPPVMATARALAAVPLPPDAVFWLLSGRAVLWCGLVFAGYGWLRRRRS